MMFMARFLFPLFGLGLFSFIIGLWMNFSGRPLPVHIAMIIGIMAIVGAAAFIGSALAWWEPTGRRDEG